MAISLCQLHEVRQRLHVGMRVTAAIVHVLPLAHHSQYAVIEADDLHGQVVLQTRRQFLNVHLNTALTCHTGYISIREA